MKKCNTCGEQDQSKLITRNGYILSDCKKCAVERSKKHYLANKEEKLKYAKKYREENSERILEYKRIYRLENKDKIYNDLKNWRINNRDKKNASHAKRRSFKINAIPVWVDKDHLNKIKDLYKLARELTLKTGIEYQVDHIIPLINPLVCGLHAYNNLRIVDKFSNLSKGNKLLDEDIV